MPGKIVAMKVYEGNRAREVGFMMMNQFILTVLWKRCSEAARFNQKFMYDVGLRI
jgi:hypothetical protein